MGSPWDAGRNPDPNIIPTPAPRPDLTDQQRALLLALQRRDPKLACMYFGALLVLADEANPERLPMAAHALRELMEKLPESLDIPLKATTGELSKRVGKLWSLWKATVEKSACHNGGQWQGQIDSPLRELLQGLNAFFDWFSVNHRTRCEEAVLALRRLDTAGRFLPASLEDKNVRMWRDIRECFVTVAHHNLSRDDFSRRLDELERFLLDRFQPRTFADFDAIDALLKEAARDG